MIWKINKQSYKPMLIKKQTLINIGDKKEIRKFAWFPININNEYKIFLESYVLIYEYKRFKSKIYPNIHGLKYSGGGLISAIDEEKSYFTEKCDWVLIKKMLINKK